MLESPFENFGKTELKFSWVVLKLWFRDSNIGNVELSTAITLGESNNDLNFAFAGNVSNLEVINDGGGIVKSGANSVLLLNWSSNADSLANSAEVDASS